MNLEIHPDSIQMAFKIYDHRKSMIPPLIVLHGLVASNTAWKSFCSNFNQLVQPARTVIALDLRDHGKSPHTNVITYPHVAEDIKRFLIENKIQKACFVGHCFGGRASMLFSLKYPDYVEKILISDTSTERASPFIDFLPELIRIVLKVEIPQGVSVIDARAAVKKQLSARIKDMQLVNFFATTLYQKTDGSISWKPNFAGILANFQEHLLYFPKQEELVFKRPALFVHGDNSTFLIKEDYDKISRYFPKAKFYAVTNASHWVHSDKPKEFMEICLNFFAIFD